MSKALEAKHDKILKGLLKQPDNKRCINCETLGPQYAVADLQIFVCTVCSGVHRQFSHRVKGLSTSTFKPEEIKALEAGGNRVGAYTYLAKWSPSDLQKPVDRNTSKIKDWIDAVYVKKRFYSAEAAAAATHLPPVSHSQLPRRSISSNASSAGDDVPVMSMAGLLGDVKLKVDPNHLVSNAPNGLNLRATSTASSHSHDSPAPSHVSNQLFNILDEPLAETAAAPLQNAPPSAGWDAFAAPVAASGPSPPDSITWSAFDNGGPAVAPPHLTTHQLPPQQHQAQSQQQVQQQPSQQRSQVTAPYHQQQQQQSQADMATAWAAFGDSSSQAVPNQQPSQTQEVSPQQQQQQQQQRREEPVAAQPPKPAPRQELPLDLFGEGLLSSYAPPASMYAQQRSQPGGYQQPQAQAGHPYGQQQGYGQGSANYPQAQPARPQGLPHGTSFSGYGLPPSGAPSSVGPAFGGPPRQRSLSDNSGTGDVSSAPDPFSGLGGLAGTLPSMPVSRQASGSSMQQGPDMSAPPAWAPSPSPSQPYAQQGPSQAGNMSFHDPFSGGGFPAPAQNQSTGLPASNRPPPKSSGNPFA